jgi:hypothetical protein
MEEEEEAATRGLPSHNGKTFTRSTSWEACRRDGNASVASLSRFPGMIGLPANACRISSLDIIPSCHNTVHSHHNNNNSCSQSSNCTTTTAQWTKNTNNRSAKPRRENVKLLLRPSTLLFPCDADSRGT